MFREVMIVGVLGILLCACSTDADGASAGRKTVEIQQHTVSWADFQKISKGNNNKVPLAEGEGNYIFSVVKERKITLSDGQQVTPGNCHLAANPIDPNTSALYGECRSKAYRTGEELPAQRLSKSVELAEKAVKHEGSCQWVGYSRAFDLQSRVRGLMAASETRAFFAKLRC